MYVLIKWDLPDEEQCSHWEKVAVFLDTQFIYMF